MSKLTFVDLPDNVQEMVLSSVYAINKKNGYIDHTAGPAAVAQAIALLEYGKAEVAVDPAKPESEETVFQQVDRKEGVFGPVDIYRSSINPLVYAIMNRGKTALVESSNIELMPYQAAVEIVRVHGKEDRSIVG